MCVLDRLVVHTQSAERNESGTYKEQNATSTAVYRARVQLERWRKRQSVIAKIVGPSRQQRRAILPDQEPIGKALVTQQKMLSGTWTTKEYRVSEIP